MLTTYRPPLPTTYQQFNLLTITLTNYLMCSDFPPQKQAEGNKVVSSPDVQHVKRVMARQRAKDLAEHARALMSRDQQIEEMRAQLQMGKNSGSSTEVRYHHGLFVLINCLFFFAQTTSGESLQFLMLVSTFTHSIQRYFIFP